MTLTTEGPDLLVISERQKSSLSDAFISRGRSGGLDIVVGLKLNGLTFSPRTLSGSLVLVLRRSLLPVGLNENSNFELAELMRWRFKDAPSNEPLGAAVLKHMS